MTDSIDPTMRQLSDPTASSTHKAITAFSRLPDEIVQQILTLSDPNSFASLVHLNRRWHALSQQADLYSSQLARCPSHAASRARRPAAVGQPNHEAKPSDLSALRKQFAKQVKRNLFDAYLRPRETTIKLISNAISSSSVPGGEGMLFSASPRGHHVLAYNSSRIHVIDVRGDKIDITRELKILRRPVSACIKDDGSLLVVLSSEMQVNTYDMLCRPPKRTNSLILDNTPRSIALSPCGTVLAAAYDGGIQVFSLDAGAASAERRAVKCDAVDSLAFSFDGTQILGTTTTTVPPSTVILTAPYYEPSNQTMASDRCAMWTASILFPNTSKDSSHATMLQYGDKEEAEWIFTYDRNYQTFRAVRIDDLRNGSTYFTGPVPQETPQTMLLPSAMSGATYHGDLVSAIFQNKDIWIYGIPEDLEAVPEHPSEGSGTSPDSSIGRSGTQSSISRRPSSRAQRAPDGRNPLWHVLSDQGRHTFVSGHKMLQAAGTGSVKWVSGFGGGMLTERLVVGSRGLSNRPYLVTDEPDIDLVDGGRLTLLDFDYGIRNGTKEEVCFEVGTDDAEVLEEEKRDLETEVAIVRRRTVAQKRGGSSALLRAATAPSHLLSTLNASPARPQSDDNEDDDPLVPRRIGQIPSARRDPTLGHAEDDEDDSTLEHIEALDAPYAHASPRSVTTLRRAATAVAVNRRLNPRLADGQPIEYRRADGRREHPHESDADHWTPPPPPYQHDDPGSIPAFLRGPAVAPNPPYAGSPGWGHGQSPPGHAVEPFLDASQPHRPSFHRTASDSTTLSRPRMEDLPRPMSSPSLHHEFEAVTLDNPTAIPDDQISQASGSPHVTNNLGVEDRPEVPEPVPAVSTAPSHLSSQPVVHATQLTNDRESWASLQTSAVSAETVNTEQKSSPRTHGLSNAQTWPLAAAAAEPEPDSPPANPENPPQPASAAEIPVTSDFPPLPSSDQLASLNQRTIRGNPKRLSGSLVQPRTRSGSGSSSMSRNLVNSATTRNSVVMAQIPEPEEPLIISTPQGIAGVTTEKTTGSTGSNRETPLLAPVPRHPRPEPWTSGSNSSRPMVERLETVWSIASDRTNTAPETSQQQQQHHQGLPTAWASSPNLTNQMNSSQDRREGRSAGQNTGMLPRSRSQGWRSRMRARRSEGEAAQSAAYRSGDAKSRSKKCVIM